MFLFLLFGLAFLTLIPEQRALPDGYHVRWADRGRTWVTDPERHILFYSVKAVGVVGDHVLIETRHLRSAAPYGYAPCEYFLLETRSGSIRLVSRSNAKSISLTRQMIRSHEVTRTSRSCIDY